ncbi:MAG: hypothetical protein ACXVC0_09165 [Bdellovibrionota bacterium]
MTLLKTSLFLSFLFASPLAHAVGAASCLDMDVVKAVESKIHIPADSTGKKFDPCDETNHTYRLLQSLSLIKTIQFDVTAKKLAAPLNEDILPTDFWGYFSTRANSVVNEDKTDEMCSNGFMAYVFGAQKDGVVHLCPVFYDDSQNIYDRASAMLHEVRHFAGYTHVTCTRGPSKGKAGACDPSIGLKGSYAVTVESITKMALMAQNLSPATRFMLKTASLTWSDSSFNQNVFPQGFSSLYLTGDDGKGYFFNGKTLKDGPTFGSAHVLSRLASLSIFPADKSDAFTIDFFSKDFAHLPALGTMALGYNKLEASARPTFVDVINGGNLTGFVSDDTVSGMLQPETEYTVVKLDSSAKGFYTAAELGQSASNSLYALTEKDEMYKITFLPGKKSQSQKVANFAAGFKSFAMLNSQRLGLNEAGDVVLDAQGNNKWAAFTPLEGQKFTLMSRPFYWSEYYIEQ